MNIDMVQQNSEPNIWFVNQLLFNKSVFFEAVKFVKTKSSKLMELFNEDTFKIDTSAFIFLQILYP